MCIIIIGGNMKKTITITAYNRPEYLKQVLESLSKNDLNGFHLYCGVEPGNNEIIETINSINFIDKTVVINEKRLGINGNPFNILSRAFNEGSEFNVYLEDDVIISPDAIKMSDWYLNYPCKNDYFCFNLFHHKSSSNESDTTKIFPSKIFTPYGFCLTKNSWNNYFKNNWHPKPTDVWNTWDCSINDFMIKNGYKTLQPVLSRSNNIGQKNGINVTPEFWNKTFKDVIINEQIYSTNFELIQCLDAYKDTEYYAF